MPGLEQFDDRDLATAALQSASLLDHVFDDRFYLALVMDAGAPELMVGHRLDQTTESLVVYLAALWRRTA